MPYGYGGYPGPGGYYAPPVPDQLAQLRGYQQPMNTQQPMTQPAAPAMQMQGQPATMSGPVFVNGEAGAKGFLVSANNTVMLIDADPDAHTFWLKSADASGMPSMRTFDYTERINAPRPSQEPSQTVSAFPVDYVPRAEHDALVARIEALREEIETLKAKRSTATKKPVKEDEE